MERNNYSYAAHNGVFLKKKAFTRGYIFQLTNYEHKGVSESIDSDDRNFSSAGLVE